MTIHHLILGTGRSAIGAAHLLHRLGIQARLSDRQAPEEKVRDKIQQLGHELVIGPQDGSILSGIQTMIISPGIPLDLSICIKAKQLGIQLLSEIDLAMAQYTGTQIGVTGTNGKSTTVSLMNHLLQGLGYSSEAVGNLGLTPSERLCQDNIPDYFVIELSSYQLESSRNLEASASVFTSFSPDHLERHKNLESYLKAKWNLAHGTKIGGRLVLAKSFYDAIREFRLEFPQKRPWVVLSTVDCQGEIHSDHLAILNEGGQLKFRGQSYEMPKEWARHDQFNLALSFLALDSVCKLENPIDILDAANGFEGLAHRFEKIASYQGHPIINDSKSTNVESSCTALSSMNKPCYLFLGGKDKGSSYRDILDYRDRIHHLICFGEAAPTIQKELSEIKNVSIFPSLEAAIPEVINLFRNFPAPVLLSPACASFDEFLNFEERGLYFKKEITRQLEV